MDRDLFEKAVGPDRDINRLKKIQEDIGETAYGHLNWCRNEPKESPILSEFQRDILKDIPERHDMMIRQEIQDKIDSLERKIRML